MKLKEEIIYQYDRIIINIRRIIDILSIWFSYFKVCKNLYDFDYWSLYQVQKYQLKRLRDNLKREDLYEGCERDIERMDLALKLLEIIEKDDYVIHIDENGKEIHGFGEDWNKGSWKCTKYVNIKNKNRFGFTGLEFNKPDKTEVFKGYLYTEKAWYLYHKLLTYYARNWWS